ncbi:MAG: ATP-binding protein, partial [Desulfobacteraceae bacterium]|nr:ATP-binding protein [Desulfobacteraceae bacterium]
DDLWRSDMQALNLKSDYINILAVSSQPIIKSQIIKSQNFDEEISALFRKEIPLSLNHVLFKNISNSNHHLRVINMPFLYGHKNLLVIQIGTPLDHVIRILSQLLYFIGGGILFILALTSFLGSFFARRILKPVSNVTKIVDDISHKDLHLRIPEMVADVEMKHLISSCNAMIGRLEKSFEHVNEFSSHVAHELKTPLAIIRGEVELALSETRNVDEYQRVLNISLEEVDRLIKIIKDLLLLARLDYNPDVFGFEKISLNEFLKEIHEYSSILAEQKGLASNLEILESAYCIDGDKVHLRRLFLNLINNAVKFTPSGGKINITLTVKGAIAEIAVSDSGVGISTKDLKMIFDKFFRAQPYGHKAEPGSGLGLSIARSIARAHQGEITVQSQSGQGTTFTVSLPVV